MTIVDKVISLLSNKHSGMSLKEMYEALPEHSEASIRGNINRYIKNPDALIKRVAKGVYVCVEIISSETTEDGKHRLSYSANYFIGEKSVHFFHREIVANEILVTDNLSKVTGFKSPEEMISHQKGLEAILVHGDVRDVLSRLKSESFDLLVTDPPYKVISGGTGGKNAPKGMLSKNDGKIFDHNDITFDEWLPEIYRVMKPDTQGYIFTNFLNLQPLMEAVQRAGFKIHNLLVWEKNTVTPNRWYMKNCEYVLFIRKGKAFSIRDAGSKTVHQFNNIVGCKTHETEKPVDLLRMYIRNSLKTAVGWVIDPFAGSGSTLEASLLEGAKCFTSEIDGKYIPTIISRTNKVLI